MGTTISVRTVELTRPPITTVASSALMIPPSASLTAARGRSAKLVVRAVISMGRKRTRPPIISASNTDLPPCRNCSTNAMSTMALVTTIPISSRMPIIAARLRERSVIASAASAPMRANGRLVIMTRGFRREPRLATITR